MILTAVAVVGVVGGALAFKSNAFNGHVVFCNDANDHCTVKITGVKEQATGGTATDPCSTSAFPDAHGLTSDASNACTSNARLVSVTD